MYEILYLQALDVFISYFFTTYSQRIYELHFSVSHGCAYAKAALQKFNLHREKTYMHFEFIAVSPNLDICIDLLWSFPCVGCQMSLQHQLR